MERASYEEVRDKLRPGDVIAFCGSNWFSRMVAAMGGGGVSHVGLITWQAGTRREPEFWDSNLMLKQPASNRLPGGGRDGPGATSFREMYESYDGAIWWLPIEPPLTAAQEEALDFFSYKADKRRFDKAGGFRAVSFNFFRRLLGLSDAPNVVPRRNTVRRAVEDYFCSQLVATALIRASVVANVDPLVTPATICGWRIYRGEYWLLKGSGEIRGFNTVPLPPLPASTAGPAVAPRR